MENKVKTPAEYLDNVIFLVCKEEPFFAAMMSYLDRVQTDQIPVAGMGFDTKRLNYVLYYNPQAIMYIQMKHLTEIIKHELMHILLGHVTDIRNKFPFGSPEQIHWNHSVDMTVNSYLKLPKELKINDNQSIKLIFPHEGWPTHESCDYYYIRLIQSNKQPQSGGTSCGSGPKNREGEKPQNDKGNGNVENNNQESDKQEETGDQKNGPNPIDSHKYWKALDSAMESVAQEIRRYIVNEGKKRGTVPESLQKYIEASLDNSIPWHQYLKQIIGEEYSDDYVSTFSRRNRRIEDLAASIPGTLRDRRIKLYVGIDVSGSIDDEIFSKLMGVIEDIQKKVPSDITSIYCSAQIHHVEEFKKKAKYDRHGSGGTAFTPVLDYVKKQRGTNKALVYLTDGYGDSPDGANYRGFKTIWVTTQIDPAKFGRIIKIKEK